MRLSERAMMTQEASAMRSDTAVLTMHRWHSKSCARCLRQPEVQLLRAYRPPLTRRRKMTRTRFHCKARWRPRADSIDQTRCKGRSAASSCALLPSAQVLYRFGGWARLLLDRARHPPRSVPASQVVSAQINKCFVRKIFLMDPKVMEESALESSAGAYMKPFIFLLDPAGHHVVVCVVLRGAQVDLVPPVALQRLLKYPLELGRHLRRLYCRLLDLFRLRCRLLANLRKHSARKKKKSQLNCLFRVTMDLPAHAQEADRQRNT